MNKLRKQRSDRRRNLDNEFTEDATENMSLLGQAGFGRRSHTRMEEEEYGTEYEGRSVDRMRPEVYLVNRC